MATKKKDTSSDSGLGMAVVATVVATAGALFLYGTQNGKKTRTKIKGWTLKAKGEILEKLEDAKDVTEDSYNNTVNAVLSKYAKLKKVESTEVDAFMKEMKSHWNKIKKEVSAAKKSTKTVVQKTVKAVKSPAPVAKKAPAKKEA